MQFCADLKAEDMANGLKPKKKSKAPSSNNAKRGETIPYYQPALKLVEAWVMADEAREDEIHQLVNLWNAGPPPEVQAK